MYNNCRYRNRNGTIKLIEPGQIYIFGGTNQLCYKKSRKYSFQEIELSQDVSQNA